MTTCSDKNGAPLTTRERKDLGILVQFTSVYCRARHGEVNRKDFAERERFGISVGTFPLCRECADFLVYACDRRIRCPLDPKPTCKECPLHCYRPGHRERVREIMRFSGMYLIKRGRLDLLWHYFF